MLTVPPLYILQLENGKYVERYNIEDKKCVVIETENPKAARKISEYICPVSTKTLSSYGIKVTRHIAPQPHAYQYPAQKI